MAYSLHMKAEAVAALVAGETQKAVAERFGVTEKTVKRWVDAKPEARPSREFIQKKRIEIKEKNFDEALETFLFSTVEMLQAWADFCSHPDCIKENPHGVYELGSLVLERADKLVSVLRRPGDAGGDDPDDLSEVQPE